MKRNAVDPCLPIIFLLIVICVAVGCSKPSSKNDTNDDLSNMSISELEGKAESGDVMAQFELAGRYYDGNGTQEDFAKAAEWCQKAAAQGNAEAQSNLGLMYATGKGVPKDSAMAVEWYQKAAAQGNAAAQGALGAMYGNGDGVPKDLVLAYAWMNLGATSDELAKSGRDILEKMLTPAELAEAQYLSSNWKVGDILKREKQ